MLRRTFLKLLGVVGVLPLPALAVKAKPTYYGFEVDLSKEDAIAFLHTAQMRFGEWQTSWAQHEPYRYPEVFYKGNWIKLCRTDLKDDVATSSPQKASLGECREFYVRKVRYGARTDDRLFAVVDSISDG